MLSTRQALRSSTVNLRAIVAAALALGLVLAFAASASAAPVVTIDRGPSGPTNDPSPEFDFTFDLTAISVQCSIDQGTEVDVDCSSGTYSPASPLAEGDWTFTVRASDGIDPDTVVTRSFTVDTTPPSLSVDSGPGALTTDRTPSFAFTTDGRAQCSVDQGAPSYASCRSPYTPTSLADGAYTFRVFATDAAGNQTSVQTWGPFTVDTTPPVVGVTSGPNGPTNAMLPVFGFTADGTATRVECSIDQGSAAWVACAGPTYTPSSPLADGSYTFRVRATDAAGNAQTASQRFSVDQDAPDLTIDSGPEGPTNITLPSFGFVAEAGATTVCSLDQGAADWKPCSATYTAAAALPEGRYTFRVRATDDAGNQSVESRTITVDTTPPLLSISFGPSGTTSDSTPLFGFRTEVDATVACSIDQGTAAFGPCASATTDAVVAPLADGSYVFRVQATDSAGNQTLVTRRFTVSTGTSRPPVTTPPGPALMSPFPLVRISGTLTSRGARIRLLAVRAHRGALVRVAITPPCSKKSRKRHLRQCRVVSAAATVGRGDLVGFRRLARSYRSGTVIVVRVWSAGRIGKYTRFTIVRGKAPKRVDQCLQPGATRGSRCPSA